LPSTSGGDNGGPSGGLPNRKEKRENAVKGGYSDAFDMLEAVEDHAMYDRERNIAKQYSETPEDSGSDAQETRLTLLTVTLLLLEGLDEISKREAGGKEMLEGAGA